MAGAARTHLSSNSGTGANHPIVGALVPLARAARDRQLVPAPIACHRRFPDALVNPAGNHFQHGTGLSEISLRPIAFSRFSPYFPIVYAWRLWLLSLVATRTDVRVGFLFPLVDSQAGNNCGPVLSSQFPRIPIANRCSSSLSCQEDRGRCAPAESLGTGAGRIGAAVGAFSTSRAPFCVSEHAGAFRERDNALLFLRQTFARLVIRKVFFLSPQIKTVAWPGGETAIPVVAVAIGAARRADPAERQLGDLYGFRHAKWFSQSGEG